MTRRHLLLAQAPDLRTIAEDLVIPALNEAAPAPGVRSLVRREGELYHVLYLPLDWRPRRRYPLIVEYAGNGGYRNAYGDESHGVPEGSKLGYGLSAGRGYLWLCLPYVTGANQIATQWWGDPDATLRYARREIAEVCARYGGDFKRVLLAGFSRGAIGCGYLGLRDDATARLWRAFFAYSHFDGVRQWPYAESDREHAIRRLRRLRGRPVFVCHEESVEATRMFLEAARVPGRFTYQAIGFRNHNDAWVLRDLPERRRARAWLATVMR